MSTAWKDVRRRACGSGSPTGASNDASIDLTDLTRLREGWDDHSNGGIVTFNTGSAGEVVATSSGGSINLSVDKPQAVQITTGTPGTTGCGRS